MPLVEK